MAWLTEALQRPEPERGRVAMVRGHVVGDLCRHGDTSCHACTAERLKPELELSALDPTRLGIPRIPMLMVANGHTCGLSLKRLSAEGEATSKRSTATVYAGVVVELRC